MKIWKLVSGILSIVLFVFVSFQSCAAGLANSLEENGEISGSAGLIVAVLMLVGGIVSIVTMKIWSGWCLINMILAVVALIAGGKNKAGTQDSI